MTENKYGFGGVEFGDSVIGTAIETSRQGTRLLLNERNDENGTAMYAFAACGIPLGSTAMLTIRYYNRRRATFMAALDSILNVKNSVPVMDINTFPKEPAKEAAVA